MSYLVIGILIIVGIIWAISSFIEWVDTTSKKVSARMSVKKTKTITQVNEETGTTETIVVKQNLIERNQDIIQECRNGIYAGDRSYYVENEVRDCIGKITERDKQEKEETARLAKSARKLFEKNKDIIDKFLEIAERKIYQGLSLRFGYLNFLKRMVLPMCVVLLQQETKELT